MTGDFLNTSVAARCKYTSLEKLWAFLWKVLWFLDFREVTQQVYSCQVPTSQMKGGESHPHRGIIVSYTEKDPITQVGDLSCFNKKWSPGALGLRKCSAIKDQEHVFSPPLLFCDEVLSRVHKECALAGLSWSPSLVLNPPTFCLQHETLGICSGFIHMLSLLTCSLSAHRVHYYVAYSNIINTCDTLPPPSQALRMYHTALTLQGLGMYHTVLTLQGLGMCHTVLPFTDTGMVKYSVLR